MIRSSDELFAEADREHQATPKKEPWQLRLKSGVIVTFRHPDDAPVVPAGSGFRGELSSLIADSRERRLFWEEWADQPSYRVVNLSNAVVDYYTAEDGPEEGKGVSAS